MKRLAIIATLCILASPVAAHAAWTITSMSVTNNGAIPRAHWTIGATGQLSCDGSGRHCYDAMAIDDVTTSTLLKDCKANYIGSVSANWTDTSFPKSVGSNTWVDAYGGTGCNTLHTTCFFLNATDTYAPWIANNVAWGIHGVIETLPPQDFWLDTGDDPVSGAHFTKANVCP